MVEDMPENKMSDFFINEILIIFLKYMKKTCWEKN